MKRTTLAAIIGALTLISGCATAYVSHLRSEFLEDGASYGIYYGDEEYPCIYPATRIAMLIEVPTWWWWSNTSLGRDYEIWLWPLGAPLSIVDVGVSMVTDTIMLPYDYLTTKRNKNNER